MCYPFYDKDPFVLTESPNVYFIGNQPELKFCHVTGIIRAPSNNTLLSLGEANERILIILLPEFSKTHSAALIELSSLNVIPLNFIRK